MKAVARSTGGVAMAGGAGWPSGARLAMSFVVNVEEGSEMNPAEGDRSPEVVDELGVVLKKPVRNFGNESNYQYGVKAGAPRVMLRARQGRIITVTTSLGTMVRAGYLLYGSSKAAAESATAVLAADLQGTGVTANVLVPGGVTNTPLVGEDAGDRGKMLQPEIMPSPGSASPGPTRFRGRSAT